MADGDTSVWSKPLGRVKHVLALRLQRRDIAVAKTAERALVDAADARSTRSAGIAGRRQVAPGSFQGLPECRGCPACPAIQAVRTSMPVSGVDLGIADVRSCRRLAAAEVAEPTNWTEPGPPACRATLTSPSPIQVRRDWLRVTVALPPSRITSAASPVVDHAVAVQVGERRWSARRVDNGTDTAPSFAVVLAVERLPPMKSVGVAAGQPTALPPSAPLPSSRRRETPAAGCRRSRPLVPTLALAVAPPPPEPPPVLTLAEAPPRSSPPTLALTPPAFTSSAESRRLGEHERASDPCHQCNFTNIHLPTLQLLLARPTHLLRHWTVMMWKILISVSCVESV